MTCARVAKSRNEKFQDNADCHSDQDRCSGDPVRAIPKRSIGASTLISKAVHGIGSDPTEKQRCGIQRRENWKYKKQKHNEIRAL